MLVQEVKAEPGKSSPCLFNHPQRDMCAFAHGDDFVISGKESDLMYVQEYICAKYITKVRGIIGPEPTDRSNRSRPCASSMRRCPSAPGSRIWSRALAERLLFAVPSIKAKLPLE